MPVLSTICLSYNVHRCYIGPMKGLHINFASGLVPDETKRKGVRREYMSVIGIIIINCVKVVNSKLFNLLVGR